MPARGRVSGLITSMGYSWPDNYWEERPTIYKYILDYNYYYPLNIRASIISRVVLTYKDFNRAEYI